MTRSCSICDHPQHRAINSMLVAGQSCRAVAAAHGVDFRAVDRHRRNHLPTIIRQAAAAALERVDEGMSLLTPQTPAAPAHALPEAVAPEPIVRVSPVRARQRTRGIQLSDTPPPAPADDLPGSQTGTPTSAPAPRPGVLDVYGQSINLRDRAMALLEVAERAGDVKTALTAIREARGVLEHLSRLEERNQSAAAAAPLDTSTEWIRTRTAIVAALADFPEARVAVAEALVATGALH